MCVCVGGGGGGVGGGRGRRGCMRVCLCVSGLSLLVERLTFLQHVSVNLRDGCTQAKKKYVLPH